eukprot:g10737.t1
MVSSAIGNTSLAAATISAGGGRNSVYLHGERKLEFILPEDYVDGPPPLLRRNNDRRSSGGPTSTVQGSSEDVLGVWLRPRYNSYAGSVALDGSHFVLTVFRNRVPLLSVALSISLPENGNLGKMMAVFEASGGHRFLRSPRTGLPPAAVDYVFDKKRHTLRRLTEQVVDVGGLLPEEDDDETTPLPHVLAAGASLFSGGLPAAPVVQGAHLYFPAGSPPFTRICAFLTGRGAEDLCSPSTTAVSDLRELNELRALILAFCGAARLRKIDESRDDVTSSFLQDSEAEEVLPALRERIGFTLAVYFTKRALLRDEMLLLLLDIIGGGGKNKKSSYEQAVTVRMYGVFLLKILLSSPELELVSTDADSVLPPLTSSSVVCLVLKEFLEGLLEEQVEIKTRPSKRTADRTLLLLAALKEQTSQALAVVEGIRESRKPAQKAEETWWLGMRETNYCK